MKKTIKKALIKLLIALPVLLFFAWLKLDYILERILFQPTKLDASYPFQFNRAFEEINLNPEKDVLINALYFKTKDPKGVILYFHGNRDNLQRWGKIASDVGSYFDYDVFVMDYRCYGKSIGTRDEDALNRDALFCYNYVKTNYAPKEIIIYGRSLGTGIASCLASEIKADKLILETPYHSVNDLVRNYFSLFSLENRLSYKLPSYQYLQHVNCPILIFHGTKDEIVPYSSGKKLYESLVNKNVTFITIPNGKHNNLGDDYKDYWEEMSIFLSKY